MKTCFLRLLFAAALLVAPALCAHAAPPPYHLTTVSWVIATRDNLDQDDKYVTLIGHITGRDEGGDYFFTDGTGTVRLDPNDAVLPVGPRLVIGGRIDQAYLGIGHLEVDVRNWHYAHRH
jgi:uncharacterized protein YdeI (BOF family)